MNRFLLIFPGLLITGVLWAQGDWKLRKDEDGIRIEIRESENSNLKEYRITAIIDHPLDVVYDFLTDLEYRPEWVIKCRGLEIIDTTEKGNILYHTSYDIPWPMQDRKVVVEASSYLSRDLESAHLLTVKSDFDFPSGDDVVLMPAYREEVTLQKTEVNKTEFRAEGFADPGGKVPAWIVNMFLVNGSFESVERTRKEINKRAGN